MPLSVALVRGKLSLNWRCQSIEDRDITLQKRVENSHAAARYPTRDVLSAVIDRVDTVVH